MTTNAPLGLGDQREAGRQLVLSRIRNAGRIARIDIATESGISPATVTSVTAELIAAGLIHEDQRELDRSAMKRGRPRVDLKIRGDAYVLAGMKISDRKISVAILDFEGKLLSEFARPLEKHVRPPDELVTLICETLATAAREANLNLEDIAGVGIGIAGIVDAPGGMVSWTPLLGERNIPLRAMLAKKLDMAIFLDNDANLLAVAEQWFGTGRDVSDFIVVTIEQGVGMGIVIDNKIYRGTRGFGAEFGHTKVQLDGALCRCGQRGCLEAYVSDYALLREADIVADSDSAEKQMLGLIAAAQEGNEAAVSIFSRAGRMFAMGLANIVNIFDPALIILSGEQMQLDHIYASEVIEAMKASVILIDGPPPDVRIHKWGDSMWARGAAAYAIEGITHDALRHMSTSAS